MACSKVVNVKLANRSDPVPIGNRNNAFFFNYQIPRYATAGQNGVEEYAMASPRPPYVTSPITDRRQLTAQRNAVRRIGVSNFPRVARVDFFLLFFSFFFFSRRCFRLVSIETAGERFRGRSRARIYARACVNLVGWTISCPAERAGNGTRSIKGLDEREIDRSTGSTIR